jgi:hypothetical protein
LLKEIETYERWAAAPINTERSQRYVRAVQSTTLAKSSNLMLAYMGFVSRYFNQPADNLTLAQQYTDAQRLAAFVSYLKARTSSRGHISKHLSLAKKVCDFLQSGSPEDAPIRSHVAKMDRWLSKLETQVSASMPSSVKENLPEASEVWEWVSGLAEKALTNVERDMEELDGTLSEPTAWQVERALIACLVTGRYCPPCRLSLIKSTLHPRFNGRVPCMVSHKIICMSCNSCLTLYK